VVVVYLISTLSFAGVLNVEIKQNDVRNSTSPCNRNDEINAKLMWYSLRQWQ